MVKKGKRGIHPRYGKFNAKRSFGKVGDFDLDLITTYRHVLDDNIKERKSQGYYIRTIPDKKTNFWRLYIQKK